MVRLRFSRRCASAWAPPGPDALAGTTVGASGGRCARPGAGPLQVRFAVNEGVSASSCGTTTRWLFPPVSGGRACCARPRPDIGGRLVRAVRDPKAGRPSWSSSGRPACGTGPQGRPPRVRGLRRHGRRELAALRGRRALAAPPCRDVASDRGGARRAGERRRGGLLGAPRRGVRRRPVAHRPAEEDGADLEAGALSRRTRLDWRHPGGRYPA